MLAIGLALLVITAAQDRPGTTLPDSFAAAKTLYASGVYEEALSRLAAPGADSPPEVEQYRVLCLLALGRAGDAERTLEGLVTRNPLFTLSNTDVSPRLVGMLRDVRKRLLPVTVRNLYGAAKADFEHREYAKAATQLNELMMLLADEDLIAEQKAFLDLRMLAEGFLLLAERELAAAARAKETGAPVPAARDEPPPPPPIRVYSVADRDVIPPVEIARTMPAWSPPHSVAQATEYRGVIRIVINEQGLVEIASLVQSVVPAYDDVLVAAAKNWQFRPATKDGQPVKYQKIIGVVVKPR